MSKVKNENYITIQGWMVNDLHLKGNELIIYALIYGFSQDGEQRFTGSLQYIADWTNSTKAGVSRALKKLVEKELIEKYDSMINGVKFCEYRTTKYDGGMIQSIPGYDTKYNRGIIQSMPNKIIDNTIDNTTHNKEQQIVDLFNDTCVSFPRVRSISEARKKSIKARLNKYSVEEIKEAFEKAEASDFMKGANNRNWTANFDWIMKDTNIAKILDGNYDNKAETKQQPKPTKFSNFQERNYNMDDLSRSLIE